MDAWFSSLAAGNRLSAEAARSLHEHGFAVLPGPVPEMDRLAAAYDAAVASADPADVRMGRSNTRVADFVNRGGEFGPAYVFPPLLEACCRLIGRPFKLSSMQARTVRPGCAAQELHVDVRWESADWPLVGFILMVDGFRPDNGATRFLPGSHRSGDVPGQFVPGNPGADCAGQVLACADAGSLVIFHGSVWHGHTANTSDRPRRSLQGAFIPRDGNAVTDFAARMHPETRAGLSPLAQYLLGF